MNDLNFAGQNVLVVGGSSGIGNGIARAFRQHGASVYTWGTRASAADYSAAEGSDLTGLHYAQLDVSNPAVLDSYSPPFTTLNVLVLSQGAVEYQRREYTMETFARVVRVNLHSLLACSTKFYEMLRNQRGSIVIVSSTAAYHANIGNPAYNASKAGAVGLTRTLGAAWAAEGIRVNGIAPGMVDTKMTKVTTGNPARLDPLLKKIPAGRIGTPADMGAVALFLASPLAAYIVGQTIPVDGGLMLV